MDWKLILDDLMTRKCKPILRKFYQQKNQKKLTPGEEDLAEIAAKIKELQDKYGFVFSDDASSTSSDILKNLTRNEYTSKKNKGRNFKNRSHNGKMQKDEEYENGKNKNININFNINNNDSHVYFQTKMSNTSKNNSICQSASDTEEDSDEESEYSSETEDEEEHAKYLLEKRLKNKRYYQDSSLHKTDMPSCSENSSESVTDKNLSKKEMLPVVTNEDVNELLSNYNPKMARFLKSTKKMNMKEKLRRQRNNEASRRSRAKAKLRYAKLQQAWIDNATKD